jgi:hypothetical protein
MAEGSKENSVRLITLDNGFQVGIANLDGYWRKLPAFSYLVRRMWKRNCWQG